MTAAPWPRDGVYKDGRGSWFAPSASRPGMFWRVEFCTAPGKGIWFLCGCEAARRRGRMGTAYEHPCRHVLAVGRAEQADGYEPRSTPPVAVSALVD